MKRGLFVISLDFELLWGVRDKRTIETYGANLRGVREVIPSLLESFDAFGIQSTFATVGFLFAHDKKDLVGHLPEELPSYTQKKYSPYEARYIDTIGESEQDDQYHYAASLIQMIREAGQEIASHTFSHYYCLEGASLSSFEADLRAAKKIAAGYGIDLKSIVFPRNQYSAEHLSICRQLGFTSYRGNEKSAIYQPRKNEDLDRKVRAVKFADSYANLTGHHTFTIDQTEDMVNIPASRFLRPYSKKLSLLDPLRLQRIRSSMRYAAENNQAYHLWWHPHNFGINIAENLQFLRAILEQYQVLQKEFGMESKSMKQIADEILIANGV
jgi:peptidoglycan/xylan/chitin deacetylase (PgdA/CDA1 family)